MVKNWLFGTEESRTTGQGGAPASNWSPYAGTSQVNAFSYLVETLADSVRADCAWVAECVSLPEPVLKTLAVFAKDGQIGPVEYSIAESPARNMFDDTGVRLIPANAQEQYPRDRMLQECAAAGYADVPLVSSTGQVLGLLAVAFRRPLIDNRMLGSELRLCANRATIELERRRADAHLRESEARLKLFFEHAPDAYLLLTLDGKLIEANRATEKLTGLKRATMVGHSVLLPGLMPEADIRRAASRLQQRAAGAPASPEEFSLLHRDGRTVSVESYSELITVGGERLMLLCLRDITRRKMAEQARQQKMDRGLELQNGLIAVATHEAAALKTFAPIAAVATRTVCELLSAIGVSIWVLDINKEQVRCVDHFHSASGLHSAGESISLKNSSAPVTGLEQLRELIASSRGNAREESLNFFEETAIRNGGRIAGLLRVEHDRNSHAPWEPEELRLLELMARLLGQRLSSLSA